MCEETITLDNPLTDEQWDMIADVDFDNTEEVTFHTKNGKDVVFVKQDAFDELSVLRRAVVDDRLLILPCKVGDVLHRIYSMNHIEEDRVMGFLVSASGVWYWDENHRETPIEKIGKTVFLTRADAEAALRGGADG